MTSQRYLVLLVVLCAWMHLPSCAQEITFADLWSGTVAPLSMTARELTTDWLQISHNYHSDSAVELMLGLRAGPAALAQSVRYFTRGQTVISQGQTYLVTYQLPVDYGNLVQAFRSRYQDGGAAKVSPVMTPETSLALTLLNMREVGSLADCTPVDPNTLFTANEKATTPEKAAGTYATLSERSEQTRSISNLRQLALSVQMWAQEHGERLPTIIGQQDIARQLNVPSQVLVSPVTGMPYRFNYLLSGKRLEEFREPWAIIVLFYDETDRSGARGAAFLDGHVEYVTASRWKELTARHKVE